MIVTKNKKPTAPQVATDLNSSFENVVKTKTRGELYNLNIYGGAAIAKPLGLE